MITRNENLEATLQTSEQEKAQEPVIRDIVNSLYTNLASINAYVSNIDEALLGNTYSTEYDDYGAKDSDILPIFLELKAIDCFSEAIAYRAKNILALIEPSLNSKFVTLTEEKDRFKKGDERCWK